MEKFSTCKWSAWKFAIMGKSVIIMMYVNFVYVQSGNWLKFSNLVLVGNTEACMKNEYMCVP